MPSKLLIAAAEARHAALAAGPFGVHATVSVDGAAVMDRVKRERERFVGFVLESIEGFPEADRLRGHARFVAPGMLDVDGERVHARAFVVATGSSPFIPSVFDAVRDRVVVNDNVFAWDTLPASIVVFGAGVIGLELGQALHRLGVRTRIFGRSDTVGPIKDPVVKSAAKAIFGAEFPVDFDANVIDVSPDGERGVAVQFVNAEGVVQTEIFETALVAAGRLANVTGLGLENLGFALPPKVSPATLQWGTSNIFLAGDVTSDIPLLHEAADEGAIAGENAALYPNVHPGQRRSGLGIAFTDPGLAIVGGGFDAASSQGAFAVGSVDFGNQGRSRVMLQNRGIARLYASRETRRFLGAEMVAPRAEHLAHLLCWAHQSGMTVDLMLQMAFYHPVIEEGLRTALRALVVELDNFKA
jgi:dihydrolipoamide dehydrogenase